jgi:hypothetical protein
MQHLGVGGPGGLVSEGGREYDLCVFSGLEGQFVDVVCEEVQQVFLYDECEKLVYRFRAYFCL